MRKLLLAVTALVYAATILPTPAFAGGKIQGSLSVQADLGEIAANGPADQTTARVNLGLGNIATLNMGTGLSTDGVNLNVTGGGGSLTVPTGQLLSGAGNALAGVSVGNGLQEAGGALSVIFGTSAGTVVQGNDSRLAGGLTSSQIPTSPLIGGANSAFVPITLGAGLGLVGNALTATGSSLTIPNAGVLSGNGAALSAANASSIESVLGFTPLNPANNGAEFQSSSAVRSNLGLGTISTQAMPAASGLLGSTGTSFAGVTVSTGLQLSSGSLAVIYGTGAGTAMQGNDSRVVGAEQAANKNVAGGYAGLNGSTQVPVAELPVGTTTGTVAAGNDSRLANAEQTTNRGAANGYPILGSSSQIPIAEIPIGTTSGTVAAGNDGRIAGAEQTANKGAANGYLGLNSGGQAPYSSLPVGTAANTIAAGNDSRIVGAVQSSSIPSASLLAGNGSGFTGVSIGSGLGITAGVLSATGTSLVIPTASVVKANGSAFSAASAGDIAAVLGYTPANPANFGTIAALAIPASSNLLGSSGVGFTPVSASTGLSLSGGALTVTYGTAAGSAAQGNDSRITGALQAATAASTYATVASLGPLATAPAVASAHLLGTNSAGVPSAASLVAADITAALTFTPYSAANPNGYINSSSLSNYALISSLGPLATAAAAASLNIAGTNSAGTLVAKTLASGDLPVATSSAVGAVKPDGTTTSVSAGALSVVYGTAANTAAQGNDSRITGAQQASGKGVASGYPGLDTNALVPLSQLPNIPASQLTGLSPLATQSAVVSAPVTGTNGAGQLTSVSAAALTALVNQFSSTLSGAVPSSGTPTGRVLTDAGWATVASGVGSSTSGQVTANSGGAVVGLTNAALTALIQQFSSSASGAVPSPGSPTGKVLTDGGWAAPAASAGSSTNGQVLANSGGSVVGLTQAQLTANVVPFSQNLAGAVPAPGTANGSILTDSGWGAAINTALYATLVGPAAFTGLVTVPTQSSSSNDTHAASTAFTQAVLDLGLPGTTAGLLYGTTGQAGIAVPISLGTNLSMSGNTLNASGTGGSGSSTVTLSGDITGSGSSTITTTLKAVGTAGLYGTPTTIPCITLDANGRTTGVTVGAAVLPAANPTATGVISLNGSIWQMSRSVASASALTSTPVATTDHIVIINFAGAAIPIPPCNANAGLTLEIVDGAGTAGGQTTHNTITPSAGTIRHGLSYTQENNDEWTTVYYDGTQCDVRAGS